MGSSVVEKLETIDVVNPQNMGQQNTGDLYYKKEDNSTKHESTYQDKSGIPPREENDGDVMYNVSQNASNADITRNDRSAIDERHHGTEDGLQENSVLDEQRKTINKTYHLYNTQYNSQFRDQNDATPDESVSADFESPEFEERAKEYFSKAPIKFKSRKGNKQEEIMHKLIKKHKITIPVIYIRGSLYLIGVNKCSCELKYDTVMVK